MQKRQRSDTDLYRKALRNIRETTKCLGFILHLMEAHPDYEYCATRGAKKPAGSKGWTRNASIGRQGGKSHWKRLRDGGKA